MTAAAFKSRTHVICVNTTLVPGEFDSRHVSLTPGKEYFVISVSNERLNNHPDRTGGRGAHVRVINDSNIAQFYRAWRFKEKR